MKYKCTTALSQDFCSNVKTVLQLVTLTRRQHRSLVMLGVSEAFSYSPGYKEHEDSSRCCPVVTRLYLKCFN